MSDNKERHIKEIKSEVAMLMNLSEEQKNLMVRSGRLPMYSDRINWTCQYFKQAGILINTKRGFYRISETGRNFVMENGFNITIQDLEKWSSFRNFQGSKSGKGLIDKTPPVEDLTPEELIEKSHDKLNKQLSDDLLSVILDMDPFAFERLVLDLLNKMGYGGKLDNPIIETSKTNDGGIDGLIKEDALGLDHVYVQAKRWRDTVVRRTDIQQFVGALTGFDARKGVFITTSTFTKNAYDCAENTKTPKVVLIDGKRLTDLMIAYDVGVSTQFEYKIKSVDLEYFELKN